MKGMLYAVLLKKCAPNIKIKLEFMSLMHRNILLVSSWKVKNFSESFTLILKKKKLLKTL